MNVYMTSCSQISRLFLDIIIPNPVYFFIYTLIIRKLYMLYNNTCPYIQVAIEEQAFLKSATLNINSSFERLQDTARRVFEKQKNSPANTPAVEKEFLKTLLGEPIF